MSSRGPGFGPGDKPVRLMTFALEKEAFITYDLETALERESG